ncbi:IS21 family transposase [Castellaniella sp.]|uniref:IS21 family transposase n=1 Tax=Castellaniella sp. TaxID=1955812 RepID=UPI002AFF515A|nr:IS21 family transposase [Castellaniella sp.]
MIHKIKGMYDQGHGMSIRAISAELGISRNTVRKYLQMDETQISDKQAYQSRSKSLDTYRDYLAIELKRYPKLTAVKLARRLRAKVGDLAVSDRSIRRYVQDLKQQVACGQLRYYEPVLQTVPGVQCQVDPGELREVLIGGQARTVHFVVFVLSYSRLLYVGLAFKALDTAAFIELHDQAMRYFGGVPEECIYDQTKLVVIDERYRELTVNARFYEYATHARFRIHACEGYDPESKGKVEAGVKYVKTDCLYGEEFASEQALREHLAQWLEDVANARLHGTTGQIPRELFEKEERKHLRPYNPSFDLTTQSAVWQRRRADKTGLISWQSNKYSVPLAWQRAYVGVVEQDGGLVITDLESGSVIATHTLCVGRGQIAKNNHHYRDHAQRITDLEQEIATLIPSPDAQALCATLKHTSPRIYKDQLVAVCKMLRVYAKTDAGLIAALARRPSMTATQLERYLQASASAHARGRTGALWESRADGAEPLDLTVYAQVGQPGGQEVDHECA